MQAFFDWIQQIMVFLILITVIEMILPSSSLKKYVRLASGLLLILLFLQPVFHFLKLDFSTELDRFIKEHVKADEKVLKKSIEFKKNEIEAEVDAYTLKQTGKQLIEIVQPTLEEKYGVIAKEVSFQNVSKIDDLMEEETNVKIIVTLEKLQAKGEIQVVESVSIFDEYENDLNIERSLEQDIETTLANEWKVRKKQVELEWVGGT